MRRTPLVFFVLAAALVAGPARAACVTDDTGTRVCLDAPPRRAVSLYGAFTETLAALGAADTLVARTKNDDSVPAVAKLPQVGTGLRPNVEYLLALRPELVVARGGKAGREALDALRARGVKVAAFDPGGLTDLYATIERLGVLWGKEAEARALAEKLRGDVARVEKRAQAGVGGRRLRVVYEVRAEPLTVAGSGGLVDDLIAAAGGENAVKNPKKILSFDPEALLRLDPDVYVIQTGPMNPNPAPPGDRATLRPLRAVKQGRVLNVDEDLFARPGPHVAEAAETLSRFLYPELWVGKK
ncbi:MAG: ABC transporter substrate-binding protein [Deltaproteobacteria bacterium]|nr:ABC transporter substrate-binding protein [Deltaproteobacteria bacterium]